MILITLLGQTSSGKSEMAVDLAHHLLNNKKVPLSSSSHEVGKVVATPTVWIVNCDSRQVYQQLNIGTGKVHGKWVETKPSVTSCQLPSRPIGQSEQVRLALGTYQGATSSELPPDRGDKTKPRGLVFFYKTIPHFLIDFVAVQQKYNVSNFVQDFIKLLETPEQPDYVILTGGTGLYAKAVYNEMELGQIQPEFEDLFNKTKSELQKLSLDELQNQYHLTIPKQQTLNNSDFHNPRRLQSFLLRNKAKTNNWLTQIDYPEFENKFLFAISRDQDELKELIEKRLQARIEQGLLEEVQNLVTKYGHQRIEEFGLEYRLTSLYLKGQLTEVDWKSSMLKENLAYAKRQLTWLKKEPVVWVETVEQISELLTY
jgi:tRNA dimethylallyltransferase